MIVSQPRCGARNRKGEPCSQPALYGGRVCRFHGGWAPQVRAAGERRLAEDALRRSAHIWSTDPAAVEAAAHPAELLLEELARTVSIVRRLQDRLLAEAPDSLVFGVTETEEGTVPDGHGGTVRVASVTRGAKPSVWLQLFGEERDRLLKQATAMASLGLEERRVRLEEAEVALVGDAIRAGLTAILPPELQRDALAAASRYLLTIDATAREPRE